MRLQRKGEEVTPDIIAERKDDELFFFVVGVYFGEMRKILRYSQR